MTVKTTVLDTLSELEALLEKSDGGLFITDGNTVPIILTAFAVTMQAVAVFSKGEVSKKDVDLLMMGVAEFAENDPAIVAEMMDVLSNFVSSKPACHLH